MKINDKLKNLSFQIEENKVIKDSDLKDNTSIVYFYPKDDTPGCTTEAIEFSNYFEKLKKLGVKIIGVSKDSIEKHKKFKNKYNIKFDLASDDGTLCNLFNVWVEKSMYGKKYMGIERSTFVIDKDLKIISIWRKVKVKGHVEEVYNFIENLG
ncbi:MAG: peroxiredoxin [Alphaproteobacteria bacterium]|jgi:peroxiredoxin Q/BCP